MADKDTFHLKIAEVLRRIGSEKCLKQAITIENGPASVSSLYFRDLGLDSLQVESILTFLNEAEGGNLELLRSISFSFNPLLGNEGAIAVVNHLPIPISEIGLVSCGISDQGGREILRWMKNSSNLRMICMEGNSFSDKLKQGFDSYKKANPQVVVIY